MYTPRVLGLRPNFALFKEMTTNKKKKPHATKDATFQYHESPSKIVTVKSSFSLFLFYWEVTQAPDEIFLVSVPINRFPHTMHSRHLKYNV